MISLGDSQALRAIRKIRYKNNPSALQYNKDYLKVLVEEKTSIIKKKNTYEHKQRIIEINSQIDEMLFVPEYVSILFNNDKHYEYIVKNGFFINNVKYVRLLCSPGNARVDTAVFCCEYIYDELNAILKNDANPIQIADSKYNAYFSLSSSATHEVSSPRVLVVKDCIVNMNKRVDWVTENKNADDDVYETTKKLEFNLFDGQGLISPAFAKRWQDELELDYTPSAFCVRNAYIKGMVCVIDIHRFADEIASENDDRYFVDDLWGNKKDIRYIDLIVTQSQFKLWNAYDSWEHFSECCKINCWTWGVTRVTPKKDDDYILSNYQFLQALNLDNGKIESLCQPTVEWIDGVLGGRVEHTLLYLLGKMCELDCDGNMIYEKTNDVIAKAIMLNNDLVNDIYVKNSIRYSINKRIKQSYIGKLITDGNFQVMISDPYAMLQHIFGEQVVGLLKDGEHYSDYWNKRGVNKVVAMRSPLTWRSEVNLLNLQAYSDWYKYITSGIIYNVHGCDCMIAADSDFDFDIVCTTSKKEYLDGRYGGLPITYEKKTSPKKDIDENTLYLSDLDSFGSKIGFVTNISTSYYVLYEYYKELCGEDSAECKEIIKRLKICRREQGSQIDKAKGILIKDFPKHWTNEITPEEGEDLSEQDIFNNNLCIKKRPYFFKHLYTGYNKKYNIYLQRYNKKSIRGFGLELKELLKISEPSVEQMEFINDFRLHSPLYENNSVMNNICRYMEHEMTLISTNHSKNSSEEIINILKGVNNITEKDIEKMENLYKIYNERKNNLKNNQKGLSNVSDKTIEQLHKFIRQIAYKEISSNISELATIAVCVCYERHKSYSKEFVWKIFGSGLLENIKNNSKTDIMVPILDLSGDIVYLGKKYKMTKDKGLEVNNDF